MQGRRQFKKGHDDLENYDKSCKVFVLEKKMNKSQKVGAALAGIALSSVAINPLPVQAAVLNYDFTLNSSDSMFGSGSFSYDTSQQQDPSFPPLALPPKLTDFKVSFLDKTYTNVEFVNRLTVVSSIKTNPDTGELVADRLVVPFPGCGVTCQPALVIDNSSFTAFSDPYGFPTATGSVTYVNQPSTPVPEPNLTFGLCALGLGLLLRKINQQVLAESISIPRILTNKIH